MTDFPNPTNYNISLLSNLDEEVYDDLVVTENYVVMVGRRYYSTTTYPGCFFIRKTEKSSGLSSSTFQNFYYLSPQWEYSSRLAATAMNDDYFVIAYAHEPTSGGQYPYSTRARVFSASIFQNDISQEYFMEEKPDVYDIVLNRQGRRLTVLQPWGSYSYFIPLDLSITNGTYAAPYMFDNNQDVHQYTTIDTVSSLHYVTAGNRALARKKVTPTLGLQPALMCFPYKPLKVSIIANIGLNPMASPSIPNQYTPVSHPISCTVSTKNSTPSCSSN